MNWSLVAEYSKSDNRMEVKHAWEEVECLINGSQWADKDLKYSLDNLIHE